MWQFFKNYFFATGFWKKNWLLIQCLWGLWVWFFIVKFEKNKSISMIEKKSYLNKTYVLSLLFLLYKMQDGIFTHKYLKKLRIKNRIRMAA